MAVNINLNSNQITKDTHLTKDFLNKNISKIGVQGTYAKKIVGRMFNKYGKMEVNVQKVTKDLKAIKDPFLKGKVDAYEHGLYKLAREKKIKETLRNLANRRRENAEENQDMGGASNYGFASMQRTANSIAGSSINAQAKSRDHFLVLKGNKSVSALGQNNSTNSRPFALGGASGNTGFASSFKK